MNMNRKILFSLLIIGMVVSIASAGTWAYFSDVKSTSQNSFTAGTLKLNNGITTTTLFSNDDLLIPGKSGSKGLYVENTGNIPGNLYIKINPDANNKELLNYIILTVGSLELTDSYQYIGKLGAGESQTLSIIYSMDTSVTDEAQSTTAKFKIDLLLVQEDITDLSKLDSSQLIPSDDTGNTGNNGNNGNGNGNPHDDGETGNPHDDGETGNPHKNK